MNCAIYEIKTGVITAFIRNCQKTGDLFAGTNGSIHVARLDLLGVKWTEDAAAEVYTPEGEFRGWDKTITDLAAAPEPDESISRLDPITKRQITVYMKKFAKLEYDQMDAFITARTQDLPSVRATMIFLAKIVYAQGKIIEDLMIKSSN